MTSPTEHPGRPARKPSSKEWELRDSLILDRSQLPPEVKATLAGVMAGSTLTGIDREEVLKELVSHFQDGLASGAGPEDLLSDFGDPTELVRQIQRSSKGKRASRRSGIVGRIRTWLGTARQDLILSLRGLRKSPGYTSLALLTLALGIGANTSVFSAVNHLLLRSLPYSGADELVLAFLTNTREGVEEGMVGYADYMRWREETGAFQSVGLYLEWNGNVTGGNFPERLQGAVVTQDFFQVLEGVPLLGRTFSPEEHERGHGKAVILSRGLWERRYGADPGILGTNFVLDEESYEVVGVMPDQARWPRGADFWIPLTFGSVPPDWVLEMDAMAYSVIARLGPGVPMGRAATVVDQTARRAALERPETRSGFGATLVPLRTAIVGGKTERALWLLMGSVFLVLLIACVNVANLTMERGLAKRPEIALRAALGAKLSRAIRPLAWESLILSLLGGGLGILGSFAGLRLLAAYAPPAIAGLQETGVNTTLLAFAVLLTLGTGLLFTLLPILGVARMDLRDSMGAAGRGQVQGRLPVRRVLASLQFSLSVVLVVGAGMTVRSTLGLLEADPGFREENLLTMKVFMPHRSPSASEDRAITAQYRQFTSALASLPGATSASLVSSLPLSQGGLFDHIPFRPEPSGSGQQDDPAFANWNIVGAGFFETMGIRIQAGRDFSPADGQDTPRVAILSESFAQEIFPGIDPIGRRVEALSEVVGNATFEVVGIAADVRYSSLADAGRSVFYVPLAQSAWRAMTLAVRFSGDPRSRIQEAREAIWSVDSSVPVTEVRAMEELTRASLASRRFASILATAFAFLALSLALVGVYGVVNFCLRRRFRELGVRRALGARGSELSLLFLKEGLSLVAFGLLGGLPAALAVSVYLKSLLFETRLSDPIFLAGVLALFTAAALLAAVIPALRAARVDPAEVLRGD